ncbi:M24 family metallopeptidase [Acidobacteriota bacterium]
MKALKVLMIISFTLFLFCCTTSVQEQSNPYVKYKEDGSIELFDGRVIPPLPKLLGMREQYELRSKWLEKKHDMLLPMMRKYGIEMWIIVNDEFRHDPATEYVAPPRVYDDRREMHIFIDAGDKGLKRFSNYSRPTTDYEKFFEPFPVERSPRGTQDAAAGLKVMYETYNPKTIALNFGSRKGQANGLTHNSYLYLAETLSPEAEKRFVPAEELMEEYFDSRLPEELEFYRKQVFVTDVLAQRALSNVVITPGVTTVVDLKWWWYQQIASLGVGAKPWFTIHTNVQRFDPETGIITPWKDPAPDEHVYQPGEVIHMDCGFNYLGFATDWQKVAYILQEGEDDAPEGLKAALQNANITQEALITACRPGMTGHEAASATIKKLEGVDFIPDIYSHAIGYQGHAMGPSVNARRLKLGPPPKRDSILRLGSYRSIELAAITKIPEWNMGLLRVPLEDDAYLTETGYEWFRPPQTSWYLIK